MTLTVHLMWPFAPLLLVAGATLASVALYARHYPALIAPLQEVSTPVATPCNTTLSFLDLAQRYGTDKISTHHYDLLYEELLAPLRCKPVKVLEIGLGCDMGYGPGASLRVWLSYFSSVDLHFMEFDGACVAKHQELMHPATIHIGDQGNVTDLHRLINASGGGFDLVLDDGGHRWSQQLTSLDVLIHHALAPGGLYVIEDLLTSGDGGYRDHPIEPAARLSDILHTMMLELHSRSPPLEEDRALLRVVKWVVCSRGICALKTYDERDRLLGRVWPGN